MSGFETAAFMTLWLTLVVLSGLVVVVYRQISRAQSSQLEHPTSLPIGEPAPELGILEHGEMGRVRHRGAALQLLVFVTTSCDACRRLMEILVQGVPVPTTVVVSGNEFAEYADRDTDLLRVRWLINPADARELYKVNIVPTIYAIRDGHVVGMTNEGSAAGISELLRRAEEIVVTNGSARALASAASGMAG